MSGIDLPGSGGSGETTTTMGALINSAGVATPNDTDFVGTAESAGLLKKISWTNVKAFLKTYFDTLYASLSGSVSQAFSASSIELGHATDTTISRVSAGVIAVEGLTVPTLSSTSTLTNKRITKRVVSTTQSATPTINTDNGDIFTITGLAQAITSFTTNLSGTPVEGDLMMIQITDNGTARAITWGASFTATTVALPTTTVISTKLRVGFQWGGTTWNCIAVA